ncbi:MAG: glycoside hydrolase family 16 protein [Demequinaceae bacterium]|nr:glycoside hydrolase family 16 protein [Demequinaceae bacterium]
MIRVPILLVVAAALAGCTSTGETTAPAPSSSPTGIAPGGTFGDLTFSDEFDGPEVDTTKWWVPDRHEDYYPEAPWRRNFKKENVYIEDGALVIRVAREEEGFSSGTVTTGEPGYTSFFEQAFGRFEARLRFPTQQGHWCAFWLWNTNQGGVDGSGRDGTEIDIIEKAWLIDQASHGLHWDGYGEYHQGTGQTVTGAGLDDGGWHVIRLDWYPDEYVFFVDEVETWRTDAGGVSQEPNYVILSEEIGNFGVGAEEWGVGPIEDAALPDYFYVDYVRVWEYVPPDEAGQ